MSFYEKALEAVGLIKPTMTLSPIHAGYGELLFDASGGAITVYKIFGALRKFEGVERKQKLKNFERYLATWNVQAGYYMTFIHEHSEDGLQGQVEKSHGPMRETMSRLEMPSAHHMLNSREDMLDGQLHFEQLYLVLHTTTAVLPAKERKQEYSEKWGYPKGQGSNKFAKLHDLHDMYQRQVEEAMSAISIQMTRLDAKDAASLVAGMWSRGKVIKDSIRLVGDHITSFANEIAYRKANNGYEPIFDLGGMAYPSLANQIFTHKVYYPRDRDDICMINGKYQASLRMAQSPGNGSVRKYNELRHRLSADTNYRLAVQIASGSSSKSQLAAKRVLALMLAATNTKNLDMARSIDELKKLEENGVPSVGVKIMCSTWAGDKETLDRNVDKLKSAFQYWGGAAGGARLETVTDYPELGVASTLPGAIMKGATSFIPIGILSEILPIEMTTSPWPQGLIMRSGEDQAYPIDPGDDSLLDFHVYVLVGGTGKGKSVTMTELVKACLFRSGLENLPHVRYLDVGYTSKALFTYLRYMLPDRRRHEIVHYTIQNTEDYAFNMFDTPLGMREPPPQEASFLADTIGGYLSGTSGDGGMAASLLNKLGMLLVKEAYRLCADEGSLCKTYYEVITQPELMGAIKKHGIDAISGKTTWYGVVDRLFEAGEYRQAAIAQRYASPTMPDLLSVMAKSTSIQEAFSKQEVEGTSILGYARTVIQSMMESYPALRCETRLDIEGAKMVGIDMQDVASSREETNLFYMVLQNVLSRGFMADPDEIAKLRMPDIYREYHRNRIKDLRASDKLFLFDELHRLSVGLDATAPPPKAMMLLMRWIKEVRKYGIRLMLATQSMEHMPEEIKGEGMWSLLFCMGVDSVPAQTRLSKLFDVSEYGRQVLTQLNGPIPGKGAPCLFMANTRFGRIEQDLFITTSPFELWAAPTKSSNLELMHDVISKIGDPVLTARALTICFPKGSASDEKRRLIDQEDWTEKQAHELIVQRVTAKAEELQAEELPA